MKLVILLRTDLGMGMGKACAQAAHAAVLAAHGARGTPEGDAWLAEGQPTIVLAVSTEEELHRHAFAAARTGLAHQLVRDAGRTEVPAGSLTACAVGPATDAEVDAVTGALPLL